MEARPFPSRALVLGAGTMGHGIAQVLAAAGAEVELVDTDAAALERALGRIRSSLERLAAKGRIEAAEAEAALGRIRPRRSLEEATPQAELAIEAVPEDPALKKELLRRLEEVLPPESVLATNTSSLSIDALAEALDRPERFLGLHFFNPVPVMALLEVVTGRATDPALVPWARELAARLGKEPVVVRDAPGFASSRLGVALALEAMRMLEEGVASAEDIDRAMELGYRHPMGPLRLTDLVGLDVRLGIARYLESTLGERFRPPAILVRRVEEGRLGRKTGEGFYRWEEEPAAPAREGSQGA